MDSADQSGSKDFQRPVVIVGAGLAGLSCARFLLKKSVPFLVLEADSLIGGRVKSQRFNGYTLDRGFQVLLDSYPEARGLLDLDRLNLGYFYAGALIRYRDRFRVLCDPLRCPSKALASSLSPVATLGDKLRAVRLVQRVKQQDGRALATVPEEPTSAYLESLGFSRRAIENFFRPFFSGIFLESELSTSNRKFLELFRYFATGRAALPAGGMESIPAQLAEGFPQRSIRTNARVVRVSASHVDLESGERFEARRVVIACDPWNAARLLGEPPPQRGHETTVVYFSSGKPPIAEPWLVLNGDDAGPINSLCVPSIVTKNYAPPNRALISVTVRPGWQAESESQLRENILEQLRRWYGRDVDSWTHLDTQRVDNALPVQTSLDSQIRQAALREVNSIIVCGDYLDIASIQGAMHSGRKAAERILSDVD